MAYDPWAGLLLSWRSGEPSNEVRRPEAGQFLRNFRRVGRTHWELADYTSSKPLLGEDPDLIPGPYTYPTLWRLGREMLLLAGRNRDIVDHVVKRELMRPTRQIESIRVEVDECVRFLAKQPGQFVLTFVHVRVGAFGTALTSASFYGDDVAEARYFRDGLELFSCHTCGLRNVTGGTEILRIGNDGAITFRQQSDGRLGEIDDVLRFLRQNSFIRGHDVAVSDGQNG